MEVIILINKQKQEPLSQTNIGESTKGNRSTIPGCGAPKETCTENSSEGRVGGWVGKVLCCRTVYRWCYQPWLIIILHAVIVIQWISAPFPRFTESGNMAQNSGFFTRTPGDFYGKQALEILECGQFFVQEAYSYHNT